MNGDFDNESEKLESLGRRLLEEARQAVHWYTSKQRVAKQPDMQMSLAKRILREYEQIETKQ